MKKWVVIAAAGGVLYAGHAVTTAGAPAAVGSAVPAGSAQSIAYRMMGGFGFSRTQFGCLRLLWDHESGWRWDALNAQSGAYGIPQALPASKMASAGADWRTNPATQERWGLGYIKDRYGTPCAAWAFETSHYPNWY